MVDPGSFSAAASDGAFPVITPMVPHVVSPLDEVRNSQEEASVGLLASLSRCRQSLAADVPLNNPWAGSSSTVTPDAASVAGPSLHAPIDSIEFRHIADCTLTHADDERLSRSSCKEHLAVVQDTRRTASPERAAGETDAAHLAISGKYVSSRHSECKEKDVDCCEIATTSSSLSSKHAPTSENPVLSRLDSAALCNLRDSIDTADTAGGATPKRLGTWDHSFQRDHVDIVATDHLPFQPVIFGLGIEFVRRCLGYGKRRVCTHVGTSSHESAVISVCHGYGSGGNRTHCFLHGQSKSSLRRLCMTQ